MQKYFINSDQINQDHAVITGADFHHIKHVMRMKPHDAILVCDPAGVTWRSLIESFTADAVLVLLQEKQAEKPFLRVTIAQALIKKDRFELMLEKATEFGAYAIIPTLFIRSIVKIEDAETARKKTVRYQTIVKEAAEQCHRDRVPQVGEPLKLTELPFKEYDQVWVCYEASKPEESLHEAIKGATPEDDILILIGPEGGIDPAELTFLRNQGARVIDLGVRILRSETASLYVLSVLSYCWGR
jgi:16S rRNA (uracil1498-N3)-methyltransferase